MQLPKRRAQKSRPAEETDNYLTRDKIRRLERDLEDLRTVERPRTVEDLANAMKLGDFSENAEYQDAKARLSRIDGRIWSIQERLKRAIPIELDPAARGMVQVGSRVTLETPAGRKTYEILGSQESDPSQGRISRNSPLGQALLGHSAGDRVTLETGASYLILSVD